MQISFIDKPLSGQLFCSGVAVIMVYTNHQIHFTLQQFLKAELCSFRQQSHQTDDRQTSLFSNRFPKHSPLVIGQTNHLSHCNVQDTFLEDFNLHTKNIDSSCTFGCVQYFCQTKCSVERGLPTVSTIVIKSGESYSLAHVNNVAHWHKNVCEPLFLL